jgi:serine/threonine protein kinase
MSPESLSYAKFSEKSDVWAFGVTLWEMYSFAVMPFSDCKSLTIEEFVHHLESGMRPQQPSSAPDDV